MRVSHRSPAAGGPVSPMEFGQTVEIDCRNPCGRRAPSTSRPSQTWPRRNQKGSACRVPGLSNHDDVRTQLVRNSLPVPVRSNCRQSLGPGEREAGAVSNGEPTGRRHLAEGSRS